MQQLKRNEIKIPISKIDRSRSSVLRIHKPQDSSNMIHIEINMSTYVDNGIIIFNSRNNIIAASRVMCNMMKKRELTIYVGYNRRQSKTELMFFPSTRTLARWRSDTKSIDNGNSSTTEELEV